MAGLSWLARSLAGPTLWALTFSLVYALHGLGCALGWPVVATPVGSLHRTAMAAAWLLGLLACGALVLAWRDGTTREARWARAGAWVGLVSTLFTLLPVWVASSCPG